jgi:hypothetical protein
MMGPYLESIADYRRHKGEFFLSDTPSAVAAAQRKRDYPKK